MILGCSNTEPVDFGPVVVDLASKRCAELDARTRREVAVRRCVPPPARACKDGIQGLCNGDTRAWIDACDVGEQTKNNAMRQLIREYDTCRGAGRSTPAS
jgi:hypothetical protein